MAQMNAVFLRGNMTRDPEKRFLPSGSSVVNFGLAVNRRYRSGEEWKEDTCFVDIVVYGKQGDWIIEQCRKGSPILVEGRLSFRSWEGQDGQKRSKHEVVANTVHILARREDGGEGGGSRAYQGGGASRGGDEPPMTDDDIPF
ncbi:MAG: single-stranded DNA-binding protein [Candidatus Tectomicrobia bacterium]|uniref:Single-stranded DNA-binding protein n=1 Tax=Tectimicrobiota bacterium TaxID=2528274 RepID=A0A932MPP9_UNCTE|nr:single-stranded DNA-binding protein [Candidatus Tectomicrobia bacterium]